MSEILKFDFQKRKQLRFSEVNYLNDNYIFPKAMGSNKNSVPIPHPFKSWWAFILCSATVVAS